jgi:hypothetical protein
MKSNCRVRWAVLVGAICFAALFSRCLAKTGLSDTYSTADELGDNRRYAHHVVQ